MTFFNSWDNTRRADSYAKLEFPNTYFLAYRDLPEIISNHVHGKIALDFGCGTGRSTRFLKKLNFEVTGIDISPEMLKKAQEFDLEGTYRLVSNGNYDQFTDGYFDFIQSIFTFDNIPDKQARIDILSALQKKLRNTGTMIMLDSTPEIYYHEWASFSTAAFPENRKANDGEVVKIIMKDVEDNRPVEDVIWSEDHYSELFACSGFSLEASYKPLGRPDEGIDWKSELEIAPWVIYVLKKITN